MNRITQVMGPVTVYIDFDEIEEMADFGENKCAIPPKGIKYVIISGKVAYSNEKRDIGDGY